MGTQYEVEKFARGMQGEWFGFGARRFPTLEAADAYFVRFAASQAEAGVLDNGTKIVLRRRAGRSTLAIVGGRLETPNEIRRMDAE